MGFVLFIIIMGIAGGIIAWYWQRSGQRGITNAIDSAVDRLKGFDATETLIGYDNITGIAVDVDGRKMCLITRESDRVDCRVIDYSQIISSQIVENGGVIKTTSTVSQVGGALVGGALFGGVGAVVGALSVPRRAEAKVTNIDLLITVNDVSRPTHEINFFSGECAKGDLVYAGVMEHLVHWHGVLAAAIRLADEEAVASLRGSSPGGISVADEIEKLAELRDSGVLSEQEFEKQKRKLLGQ